MRRILILLFTMLSVLSFVGCSGEEPVDLSIEPNANPLPASVVYNSVTYDGAGTVLNSSSPRINSTDYTGILLSRPTVKGFEADGCFVIAGNIAYTGAEQYSLVEVTNMSIIAPASYYWVRGNFQKRIWLRSGLGEYKIALIKTTITLNNLNYEGAISAWSYITYDDGTYDRLGVYNFFVTNTRNESGAYYYPSDPIQSDNVQIQQIAEGLISGISGETNRVKALHDFVVTNIEYDYVSTTNNMRKKQDAISTLDNKMAVCEGYALLFSALARSVGIRSKYITGYAGGDPSAGHAWSGIEVNGSWSLVDTTWDDPGPNSDDPSNIRWDYFMKDDAFFATDHTWESDKIERSPVVKEVIYELKGYPRGSY